MWSTGKQRKKEVEQALEDTKYLDGIPDSVDFEERFSYYEERLDHKDLKKIKKTYSTYKRAYRKKHRLDTLPSVPDTVLQHHTRQRLRLFEKMAEEKLVNKFELVNPGASQTALIPQNPLSGAGMSNEMKTPGIDNEVPDVNVGNLDLPTSVIQPDQMGDVFSEMPKLNVDEAQDQIKGLKKKYTSLQSTNDLSTGVKRSSMKQYPFHRRFQIGGTIDMASTDPLIFNIDLQLGYRINKYATIGVGGLYRKEFTSSNFDDITGDGYGCLGFFSYEIVNSFFGYTEYQRITSGEIPEGSNDLIWDTAFYLGLGRAVNLSKRFQMTIMLLYDLNNKANDLSIRPFTLRVGYRVR